jgi:diguanylate cyclase (GGDEF)-like protein
LASFLHLSLYFIIVVSVLAVPVDAKAARNNIDSIKNINHIIDALADPFNQNELGNIEAERIATHTLQKATVKKNAPAIFRLRAVLANLAAENMRVADVIKIHSEAYQKPFSKKHPFAHIMLESALMTVKAYNGEFDEAAEIMSRLEIYKETIPLNLSQRFFVTISLARSYYWSGRYQKGIEYLSEAREILDNIELSDVKKIKASSRLDRLFANLYFELENYEEAVRYYQAGIVLQEKLGDFETVGEYGFKIALAYHYLEKWEDSLSASKAAYEEIKKQRNRMLEGGLLYIMARAHAEVGNFESAIRESEESIYIYQQLGITKNEIEGLAQLAYIYVLKGNLNRAESTLMRLESVPLEHVRELKKDPIYLETKYKIAKELKDYAGALQYHEQMMALDIARHKRKEHVASRRMEIKYRTSHINEQVAILEKESVMKTLRLEKSIYEETRNKTIFYSFILVLFGIVVFLIREKINNVKMQKLAMQDPLTGSPNRRAVEEKAMSLLSSRSGKIENIAFCLIDLDFFKRINDTYGHDMGDVVLQRFYEVSRPNLRQGDFLGRFGGEEFLMLAPNASREDIENIFSRIQKTLKEQTFHYQGKEIDLPVTVSMGVSFVTPVESEQERGVKERLIRVFKQADNAVYKAKDAGRDQLVLA